MHMSQIIIICQTLFSRYYLVLFLHLAFEKNTIIIPITQRGKLMALELRSHVPGHAADFSDRVGLELIGLIPMCILIQHIMCKKKVTAGFALLDCFSLKSLELVVTFGSSLFSTVAEQFLASLSSSWHRESH